MPRDTRIQTIMDHAEAMLAILEDIHQSAMDRAAELGRDPDSNPETIAFLEDFAERAETLAEVVEEDIVAGAIGLNNLAGPIQHLLGEAD